LLEPDELDNQLDELETRVERLRGLYEQYFLGIEKIEPAVPRKDVDRRIWTLRRSQIRNTAKRFRLHNIIQRYNTFQQYWQRICREIENGTYDRHLIRAVRKLGEHEILTIATRRRFGWFHAASDQVEPEPPRSEVDEVAAELQSELRRLSEPPPPEDEIDSMLRGLSPSAPPLLPVKTPPPEAPLPATAAKSESVDAVWASPRPGAVPSVPRPAGKLAASQSPVHPMTNAARERRAPTAPEVTRLGPGIPPGAHAPRDSTSAARRQGIGVEPVPPAITREPVTEPVGPVGLWTSPADARARARPTHPIPVSGPVGLSTPPVSPEIRELHAKLMRARDETGDPTRVSLAALAQSLEVARTKLRDQHGSHRRIDFDVVIKEGRAMVRPIIR
jgi:hypothetical protein